MKQRNKKTNKRHLNSTKPSVGFINLSEASKISPYSQEYISLLARKGKLSAQKFGRNWFTTKEAINNYLIDQGIKIILPKNLFNTSYKGKINKPFYFSNEEFINSPQEENENIYNNPKIVFAQMGIKDNLSDQSDQSDDQSKKEEVFNYFQTNVKEEEKKKEEEE
ncbi:MAG: hypothetical protein ABIA08_02210, partial [bacterium]